MAARTAVVAGTATAVSGRVARRQANKYAVYQDAQYVQQQTAAATQGAYAAPAPPEEDANLAESSNSRSCTRRVR